MKRRKLEFFAYVIRNLKYELLHIFEGKIEEECSPVWQKTSCPKTILAIFSNGLQ